jgi:hypothetical protein
VIEQVDAAIERFFRDKAGLGEAGVAISFATPDREWSAARTRPTVNVLLWQLERSVKALRAGLEERVDDHGARQRRPPTPIVDLHYLVSAWASEIRDEHQLLGALLQCVLAHRRLPEDVLSEPLAGLRLGLELAPSGTRPPGDVWGAFGGGSRAALQIVVSLPIEAFSWQASAPQAESVHVAVAANEAVAQPISAEPVITRRRHNGALVAEARREARDGAST